MISAMHSVAPPRTLSCIVPCLVWFLYFYRYLDIFLIPTHQYLFFQHYLLSEYFISKGINVDVKDSWNKTAYDYALENKNERIINLFKKIEDTK